MRKEQYEWIHSWQDENFNSDLPRILLIGDSITHNYQSLVREKLKGKAYVDYVATSYGIDSSIYKKLIINFAKYNQYNLIHFNFGLHAKHLSKYLYKKLVENIVCKLQTQANVVLANSTAVYTQDNLKLDKSWMKRVSERNEAMLEIADALNLKVNDLYEISVNIPKNCRHSDGTHYLNEGYDFLANRVVEFIKEQLN